MKHMKKIITIIPVILMLLASFQYAVEEETTTTQAKQETPEVVVKPVTFKPEEGQLDEGLKKQLEPILKIPEQVNKLNEPGLSKKEVKLQREKISVLIKQAVEMSSNETEKNYLTVLAEDIIKNNFKKSKTLWMDLKDNKLNIIFKKGTSRGTLELYISLNDTEETKKAEKYLTIFDKMMEKILIKEKIVTINKSFISPIIVMDLLYASHPTKTMLIYPDTLLTEDKGVFKTLIFRNLMKKYFENTLKPISQNILPLQLEKMVTFDSYYSNMVMHHFSHYLGPVTVEEESEEVVLISKKMGDMFYVVEELRADAFSIFNTTTLVEEEVLKKEDSRGIYLTYLVSLLARLKDNPEAKANRPYLVQVNYLLKNGGIYFDKKKKKLFYDLMKFKTNIQKLSISVNSIQRSGLPDGAKSFIASYAEYPKTLDRIINNLEKKNTQGKRKRKEKKKR
jgi:hypothetical protein